MSRWDKLKTWLADLYVRMMRRKSTSHQYPKFGAMYNLLDLTFFNIGTSLGVGPYIFLGFYAELMGPGMLLSFLFAGLLGFLSAACYANLMARESGSGAAYTCLYQLIGEFPAAVIGWLHMLHYLTALATSVRALAETIDDYTGDALREVVGKQVGRIGTLWFASYPSILCLPISFILVLLAAFLEKEVAPVVRLLTGLNIFFFIMVIVVAGATIDLKLWKLEPRDANDGVGGFFPYGVSVLFRNSGFVYYSFLGFDAAAHASDECSEPERFIPHSMLLSHASVMVLYLLEVAVYSLTYRYYYTHNFLPIAHLFYKARIKLMYWIVNVCVPLCIVGGLLLSMFRLARIMHALADDGLMFSFMAKIYLRTKAPVKALLFSGAIHGLLATFCSIKQLAELATLLALMAFNVIALSVIYLRYSKRNMENPRNRNFCRVLLNLAPRATVPDKATAKAVGLAAVVLLLTAPPATILASLEIRDLIDGNTTDWVPSALIIAAAILFYLFFYAVIVRQPQSEEVSSFVVRPMPLLPFVCVFANSYLASTLEYITLWKFLICAALGIFTYFSYGFRRSKLRFIGDQLY